MSETPSVTPYPELADVARLVADAQTGLEKWDEELPGSRGDYRIEEVRNGLRLAAKHLGMLVEGVSGNTAARLALQERLAREIAEDADADAASD